MKTFLMITALTLTTTNAAQASWFQEYCSDAESVTREGNGHNENFIEVTERIWGDEGPKDTKIRFEGAQAMMNVLSEQQISHEEQKHCPENGDYGWAMFSTVKVKNVSITKEDGSLFSEKILGVSKDRKSVNATLICQMDVSNEMVPCN